MGRINILKHITLIMWVVCIRFIIGTQCFWCCFLLLLILIISYPTQLKEIRSLNTIEDLNDVKFGLNPPRHGLKLLHWFAHNIQFINNGNMFVQFNPRRGDYGFHYFVNYPRRGPLLPELPDRNRYKYYTVGNLNSEEHHNANALPEYITRDYYNFPNSDQRNIDRLIIRLNSYNIIDHIYISEHYIPEHTYRINPQLIRAIQSLELSAFLCCIGYGQKNTCLVKDLFQSFFFQVFNDQCHTSLGNDGSVPKRGPKLQVKTTGRGFAKITWDNLSTEDLNSWAWVGLYRNERQPDGNYLSGGWDWISGRRLGSYETSVPLNHGLQVRLFRNPWGTSLCRGLEFDDSCQKCPVKIPGYKASLQLYTKHGYACVRLYIDKSFTDWKNKFYYSWVGLYSSQYDGTRQWKTWDWATNFKKKEHLSESEDLPEYDVYTCDLGCLLHTFLTLNHSIAPGVQARFFIDWNYDKMIACTEPWES